MKPWKRRGGGKLPRLPSRQSAASPAQKLQGSALTCRWRQSAASSPVRTRQIMAASASRVLCMYETSACRGGGW